MDAERLFDLSGRVAVITGGAGLLGARHCAALTGAGAEVIIVDVDGPQAVRTAELVFQETGRRPLCLTADVCREEQVSSVANTVFESFGALDILINNAARDPKVSKSEVQGSHRLESFPLDEWNLDLAVSLTGAFLCCKHMGAMLSASQHGGVILNVSSDLGINAPNQSLYRIEGLDESQQPVKPVSYSVAKAGLIGLTKYLSTYWNNGSVRANALCPGGVYNGQSKEFLSRIEELIPMNRMATIDEYEGSVLFMVSDASRYMNGAVLVVDGGRSAW